MTATTIPADAPSPKRLVLARRADVRTRKSDVFTDVFTPVQVAKQVAAILIRSTARTRTSPISPASSAEAIAEATNINAAILRP